MQSSALRESASMQYSGNLERWLTFPFLAMRYRHGRGLWIPKLTNSPTVILFVITTVQLKSNATIIYDK